MSSSDEEDQDGPAGCEPARALSGAAAIAVSADGRGVFAASNEDYLAAFSRSDSGALSQFGCAEVDRSYKSCAQARGTESAIDVAASPDARNLYGHCRQRHACIFAGDRGDYAARVSSDVRPRVSRSRARRRAAKDAAGGSVAVGARGSRAFSVRAGRSATVSLRLKRATSRRLLRVRAD